MFSEGFEEFLDTQEELNEELGWSPRKDPIDTFTFVHVGAGFGMGYFALRLPHTALITIGYEVIENFFLHPLSEEVLKNQTFAGESLINAVVDIGATLGGWALGYYITPREPFP